MANNLKIEGNYIIITDTIAPFTVFIREVRNQIKFTKNLSDEFQFEFIVPKIENASEETQTSYVIGGEWNLFQFADFIDDRTSLPFNSVAELESFLYENTGFIVLGGGGGGGITYVATDATLSGDGTPAFPLSVVQSAGLPTKSGIELNATFVGNPKRAVILFATPFADANYSISVDAHTNLNTQYIISIELISANGFTINMGVNNINNLVDVRWIAIKNGETT